MLSRYLVPPQTQIVPLYPGRNSELRQEEFLPRFPSSEFREKWAIPDLEQILLVLPMLHVIERRRASYQRHRQRLRLPWKANFV